MRKINIKEQIYHLSATDNKREFIIQDGTLVDINALTLIGPLIDYQDFVNIRN